MSYYFAIIGTKDNPLFELELGTYKQGGDGIPRFREEARHMNQFISHASLDIVEEVQWLDGKMYLKTIDRHPPTNSLISAFITAANVKFLLLYSPNPSNPGQGMTTGPSSLTASRFSTSSASSNAPSYTSTAAAASVTMPASEDNVKNFFNEVYDNWVKAIMNPFWRLDMPIKSPVFRQRVAAAGKKYL